MTGIIYVYPTGQAGTIDQWREYALLEYRYKDTLIGIIEQVKKAFRAFAEMFRPIIEKIAKSMSTVESFMDYVYDEINRKGTKPFWEYIRKINPKRDKNLKVRSQLSTNDMRKKVWRLFKRSQHRH